MWEVTVLFILPLDLNSTTYELFTFFKGQCRPLCAIVGSDSFLTQLVLLMWSEWKMWGWSKSYERTPYYTSKISSSKPSYFDCRKYETPFGVSVSGCVSPLRTYLCVWHVQRYCSADVLYKGDNSARALAAWSRGGLYCLRLSHLFILIFPSTDAFWFYAYRTTIFLCIEHL